MTRAMRKRKAKREYKKQESLKTIAIIEVAINATIEITRAIAEGFPSEAYEAAEMAKYQQRMIIGQPIQRYNKYGYYSKVGGIALGCNK